MVAAAVFGVGSVVLYLLGLRSLGVYGSVARRTKRPRPRQRVDGSAHATSEVGDSAKACAPLSLNFVIALVLIDQYDGMVAVRSCAVICGADDAHGIKSAWFRQCSAGKISDTGMIAAAVFARACEARSPSCKLDDHAPADPLVVERRKHRPTQLRASVITSPAQSAIHMSAWWRTPLAECQRQLVPAKRDYAIPHCMNCCQTHDRAGRVNRCDSCQQYSVIRRLRCRAVYVLQFQGNHPKCNCCSDAMPAVGCDAVAHDSQDADKVHGSSPRPAAPTAPHSLLVRRDPTWACFVLRASRAAAWR